MKFNDAYSQMFSGYPDAVSLQQAAEDAGLEAGSDEYIQNK